MSYQVTRYLPKSELVEIEAWLTARCVPYELRQHLRNPSRWAIFRTDMQMVQRTSHERAELVEEE